MLSSNEDIFNDAIPPYQEALKWAGHKYLLKFSPPLTTIRPEKNETGKETHFGLKPPSARH